MPHEIVIRLGGVDVTADVLIREAEFTSAVSGSPGACKLSVKDPGFLYQPHPGQTLTLDVDGKRRWGGWAQSVRRKFFMPAAGASRPCEPFPRQFVVEGVDYNILFRRRFLYNKAHTWDGVLKTWPAGTADDVQIRWMCEHNLDLPDGLDYTTLVQHVGTPNPDADGNPAGASWSWEAAMKNIALYPGAIFYINPDMQLVYADVDTADSAYRLTDAPGLAGGPLADVGYRTMLVTADGTALANDAMVWGVGQGSNSVKFKRVQDSASIDEHGLWQQSDYRDDLWRQASIDERARSIVYGSDQNKRGSKDDAYLAEATVFSPVFNCGEKVQFDSNVFGYSDVVPIRKSVITFPSPTSVSMRLSLAHVIDLPWNTHEFWFPPIAIPSVPPVNGYPYCPLPDPADFLSENMVPVFSDDLLTKTGAVGGSWSTTPNILTGGGMYVGSGSYGNTAVLDRAYGGPWQALFAMTPPSGSDWKLYAAGAECQAQFGMYAGHPIASLYMPGSSFIAPPSDIPALTVPVFVRMRQGGQLLMLKIWPQTEYEPVKWSAVLDTGSPASTVLKSFSVSTFPGSVTLDGVTLYAVSTSTEFYIATQTTSGPFRRTELSIAPSTGAAMDAIYDARMAQSRSITGLARGQAVPIVAQSFYPGESYPPVPCSQHYDGVSPTWFDFTYDPSSKLWSMSFEDGGGGTYDVHATLDLGDYSATGIHPDGWVPDGIPVDPNGSLPVASQVVMPQFCTPAANAPVWPFGKVCEVVAVTADTSPTSLGFRWMVYLFRAYMAGSVDMWADGQIMRDGYDYIEEDPSNGAVRLMSDFSSTTQLRICYTTTDSGDTLGSGRTTVQFQEPV